VTTHYRKHLKVEILFSNPKKSDIKETCQSEPVEEQTTLFRALSEVIEKMAAVPSTLRQAQDDSAL
jgi:hypothetical protein